ncbi:hypothetical protein MCOR25_000655 [Pyricularia grisea]|uniref:WKF domain-containing protein n=1 Tax=Pyricularia grisea TaxID=148305 RepID=A0A6P8AW90_PYRGI|nr:uncharacterized protein PgNI_08080 [Pyricularia grisea]KAI6382655.1 hypothetical protein MCOR25_000655 [Pyricularia grisea]TLD06434.1 hypothetical protein PgNI_08080 [Pyricularia grisea]
MSFAKSMPAQRVPAWKRLGLKLKGSADNDSTSLLPPSQPAAVATSSPSSNISGYSSNNKRKDHPVSNGIADEASVSKRSRTGLDHTFQGRRKSVTFADGTKGSDPVPPVATETPSKPKSKKNKKKSKGSKTEKQPGQDFKPTQIQPELSKYLREWETSRENWKFKKNYQTLLIKYAFTPEMVPAADFGIFLKYSRDSKGASRDWLKKSAEEVRKKDLDFTAASTGDVAKGSEQYQSLLVTMLQSHPGSGTNANGKRVRGDYNEEDFVMGGTNAVDTRDPEVTQRLVKRLRAELVLDELSSGDDSEATMTTSTTGTSDADSTPRDSKLASTSDAAVLGDIGAKDGRRKRNRNKRTLAEDDASSSSDSSDDEDAEDADEDDDTSSSGTSSSGSEDSGSESEGTLLRLQQQREELDTSSESSSSSNSDSESSSDDDEL